MDRRSDKYNRDSSRDRKDSGRRDPPKYGRDNRGNRDFKDDYKSYDNGSNWNDKRYPDNKRHSKDYKRDSGNRRNDSGGADYYRDEKRSRYDDKKFHSTSSNNYNKERSSNSSKSRYDDRKSNDQRRGGGGGGDDRRDDRRMIDERRSGGDNGTYHDKRGGGDYRKNDFYDKKDYRNNNDDRNGGGGNTQRSSYHQDRSSTGSYRTNNKYSLDRREENEQRKYESSSFSGGHSASAADSPSKKTERNSSQRDYPNEASSSTSRPDESKSAAPSSSPSHGGGGDVAVEKKVLPSARNFEALLSLPLSETAPKQPNVVTVPPIAIKSDGDSSATALTVQLPSYYNPKVINPNKYAEQIQKRKLIWGAKKTEDAAQKWGHAQFSQDSDGKVASKFMRLMGIKNAPTETNAPEGGDKKPDTPATNTNPDYKSREAMFSTMEQQYEVARQVTHTMRGVGLGFSSQTRPY
ncbi:uncharacterized protein isoform X3 [Musca autumnalis]